MDKYLVTGGAGFIGSNIVKEIINRGEFARVLDNFSTGKRENISEFEGNKNFELIEGDIRSYHTVSEAVKETDYILHQAALPSVPRSIKDPLTTNDVNINGTLNILEAAKEFKVKRVVYASSSSVYGNSKVSPKNEDMPVNPLSPYALSKYTAERYMQIYYNLYGVETVCLRYFNVFGPNQDPNSEYSAVIPKFIKSIIKSESPIIYGDGTQSRDFTYVKNTVEANLLACKAENVVGKVYNIACGKSYSLNELVKEINLILNKNIKAKYVSERIGDIKYSKADITKSEQELGYKVFINFNIGIKLTIKYFEEK